MTETSVPVTTEARCPICRRELEPVVHVGWLPAHVGVLWRSEVEARECVRGRVGLGWCPPCGFVGNPYFDPRLLDYEQEYDNALHHSGLFRAFERTLASDLIDAHQLDGGVFMEIGCGDGHFLGLLASIGGGQGYGYDPSFTRDALDDSARERVAIAPIRFDPADDPPPFDLACVRQVLEHLEDPVPLLAGVGQVGGPRSLVYADVPHGARMLRDSAVWEVMYEHFAYFTPASLTRLFEAAGFTPLDVRSRFDGQFLGIEARYTADPRRSEAGVSEQRRLRRTLDAFADDLEAGIQRAAGVLQYLHRHERRAVVWGGGARTTTYLNLAADADDVAAVVDINPNKRGTFVPGTGHPVIEPLALCDLDPDVVILTNPIYADEVDACLDRLGLAPDLVTTSGDVLRMARSSVL
jgi:SAM-dependent methyltransferase